MFKNSPIPIWVNIFLLILILFMSIQVYWFYFNHQSLIDAGITIEGVPNLKIIYTTEGRLVAMIAASVFVLITLNPHQNLVVLFMSFFREGHETIIDPIFPYANAAAAIADFVIHLVIVALEIWAFIIVYRMTKKES